MHNERCTSGSVRGVRRPTQRKLGTAPGAHSTTVPDLIKAVERLAGSVEGKRDPRIQELIEHAGYLVESVDELMDAPIEPGSATTREAFATLQGQAAAVRRILALVRR